MAVTLTGSNGLFTRIGKILKVAEVVETQQATLSAEIEDAIDEYSNADIGQIAALVNVTPAVQRDAASVYPLVRQAIAQTIIDMVDADNPQPDASIETAVRELIRQMVAGSDDVDGETTSIAVTADGGNTGDGEIVMSTVNGDGDVLQHVRAEDIVIECDRDSSSTGIVSGREYFTVKGEAAVTAITDPLWPGGSGINTRIRVSDPSEDAQNGAGRNILRNSDFEDWTTTDTPDYWSLTTGVASTDIFEHTAIKHRGSSCLRLQANSGIVPAITQTLGSSSGSPRSLIPNTTYLIAYRIDVTASSTGDVRACVKKGATVLGTSSATVDVSTLTSSQWTHVAAVFQSPATVGGYSVVVEWHVAPASAKDAFIDSLVLCPLTQVGGKGGPFIAALPGETDWVCKDRAVAAVTNSRTGEIQRQLDRFLNLYPTGLQLPVDTGGSETVADSLIS